MLPNQICVVPFAVEDAVPLYLLELRKCYKMESRPETKPQALTCSRCKTFITKRECLGEVSLYGDMGAVWSPSVIVKHINHLEVRAVDLALSFFFVFLVLRDHHKMVHLDNFVITRKPWLLPPQIDSWEREWKETPCQVTCFCGFGSTE